MNRTALHQKFWASLTTVTLAAGCASQPSQSTLKNVRDQINPTERAQRTITNFTPALRCMDDLMFRNGTRDVTLMMEELKDATQKVPISARDMMTSAISEMTRRSRAVRLSVFGSDQSNLTQLLQSAQRSTPFAVLPEYNLRGTVSQLDEDVRKQGTSLGAVAESLFGLKLTSETKFSVLGFDAAVVHTDSLTLVPGVSSKNTTVVTRRDTGTGDGQAKILSANAVFSFSSSRAEGNSQAARNMVELAAIELVGKLIRAPYWQCLGTADSDPEVQRELEDWFVAMGEDERIMFVKDRLRERRYFDGTLDGEISPDFRAALLSYRKQLGLSVAYLLDFEFFRRLITKATPPGPLAALKPKPLPSLAASNPAAAPANSAVKPGEAGTSQTGPVVADQAALAPQREEAPARSSPITSVPTPSGPTPSGPTPSVALRMFGQPRADGGILLSLTSDAPGYVYCYAQRRETGEVQRIFPNRFVRDPRVGAGRAITIPGAARFRLPNDSNYACMHAPREIYSDLPAALRWGDFEVLKLTSFQSIQALFVQATGLPIALTQLERLPAPGDAALAKAR